MSQYLWMFWKMRDLWYPVKVDFFIVLNSNLIKIHFHSWLNLRSFHDGRLHFFLFGHHSFINPSSKRLHSNILKINNLVISKENLCIRDKLLENRAVVKVATRSELLINSSSAFFGLVTKGRAVCSAQSRWAWWIIIFALNYGSLISLASNAHMSITFAITATTTLFGSMILMPFNSGYSSLFFRWLIVSVFHFDT